MTFRLPSLLGLPALLLSYSVLAQGNLPANISSKDMGAGTLYTTDAGETLYTYLRDREQPGSSACVDACAEAWPPVLVQDGADPVGNWTTVTRPSGEKQWAYKDKPVYTFIEDTHQDAMVGIRTTGTWNAVFDLTTTPPSISILGTVHGQMLVTLKGMTVYTPKNAATSCNDACAKQWRPVEAPWLANAIGEQWLVAQREDGLAQWTYADRPLYTFAGDFKAGDSNGTEASSDWEVVTLQPVPAIPDWVTFQETDLGPAFANKDQMTVYHLVSNPNKVQRETCDATCVQENWTPMLVDPGVEPMGNWTVLEKEDGTRQWKYLGYPVYTHKHDKIPGDINGDKFGTGAGIRDGWNVILKETLIQKLS